ncbi:double-stranded RNA-specific editase Adar-like isoform X3 [Rhynchophorus ferrugineus]|uniref:double-stranded RNA-specific editase Adar-like isoform X3 n=1 Tax=Rhynchophorus ferrugineus TaxID=354439 RepID=UPI003FCED00F
MSYNQRRSFNLPPQGPVGQRRQGGSFYGGQLANNRQNSPNPYRSHGGPNYRMQQNNPVGNQSYQNYSSQQPIKQEAPPSKPPVPQQINPAPPQPKPVPPQTVPAPSNPPEEVNVDMTDTSTEETKKKFWFKGKITKAEKVRRRNARLSRLLQPKNAVMILNELVKGCQYLMEEAAGKADGNQFRATVQFDGNEFIGTGRTKNAAKNVAAEIALKYLIKTKQFRVKKEENGDEKMEIQEDGNQVLPWSHIASFAMYKLFTSWGEDPALATKTPDPTTSAPRSPSSAPIRTDPKPAKKMPDNPEKMNPLMLMNQMLPSAEWEDLGKTGNPPNVIFLFKVTIDGQTFNGSGPNKKSAKKYAAFAACNKILNINYPTDIWVPPLS